MGQEVAIRGAGRVIGGCGMQHLSADAISVAWTLVEGPEDRCSNSHDVEKPVPDLNDPKSFRGVGKGIRTIFSSLDGRWRQEEVCRRSFAEGKAGLTRAAATGVGRPRQISFRFADNHFAPVR